jgi:hypothetical protein
MSDASRRRILERARKATDGRTPITLPHPAIAAIPSDLTAFGERFLDFATVGGKRHGTLTTGRSLAETVPSLPPGLIVPGRVAVGRSPLARGLAQAMAIDWSVPGGRADELQAVVLEGRALVGELGSVLVDPRDVQPTSAVFLAEVQILVARADALVPSLSEALAAAAGLHAPHALLISGPSRTADVEKTLVCPAHGPKETHLVIVEQGC